MTGVGGTKTSQRINQAVYKLKENSRSFAVVLAPNYNECIMKNSNNEFKFCRDNFVYTDLYPKLPTPLDQKVPVCGFYVVCDDRSPTSCGITPQMKERYEYKDCGNAPIAPSDLEWNGKHVQYFKGSEL